MAGPSVCEFCTGPFKRSVCQQGHFQTLLEYVFVCNVPIRYSVRGSTDSNAILLIFTFIFHFQTEFVRIRISILLDCLLVIKILRNPSIFAITLAEIKQI